MEASDLGTGSGLRIRGSKRSNVRCRWCGECGLADGGSFGNLGNSFRIYFYGSGQSSLEWGLMKVGDEIVQLSSSDIMLSAQCVSFF